MRIAIATVVTLTLGLATGAGAQDVFHDNTDLRANPSRVIYHDSGLLDVEVADDVPLVGTRRVNSFTLAYRASAPIDATFRFYAVDPASGGPGGLVAEFRVGGLPAGDNTRTIDLGASEQFDWTGEPGLAGDANYVGGWFSVRFTNPPGGPSSNGAGCVLAHGNSRDGLYDVTRDYPLGSDPLLNRPRSFFARIGGTPVGQVATPTVASLLIDNPFIAAGGATLGLVGLSGQAPAPGVVVRLSSSNPKVASVPPSETVETGSGSVPFAIFTGRVRKTTQVTISATAGGRTASTTLTVTPR